MCGQPTHEMLPQFDPWKNGTAAAYYRSKRNAVGPPGRRVKAATATTPRQGLAGVRSTAAPAPDGRPDG